MSRLRNSVADQSCLRLKLTKQAKHLHLLIRSLAQGGYSHMNISFALTTQQIRNQTKTVTRRLGWKNAKPGQVLQAIVKGQGLKKGEHPEKLCKIVLLKVRREPLNRMEIETDYGRQECRSEGFPAMQPGEFVDMFCEHNGCTPTTVITRIQFDYL
jgi:hypothetical protein